MWKLVREIEIFNIFRYKFSNRIGLISTVKPFEKFNLLRLMEDTYSTPPCCLRNHFAILLLREKKTIFNFNFEVNISWKKFVQNSWFNAVYFIKFPFNNCGSDLGWSYALITVFYFLHRSNIVHLLESCRSCQNPVISNTEERHKDKAKE